MSTLHILGQLDQSDPETAQLLLDFSLYDALCQFVDDNHDEIVADMATEVFAKNDMVRRELVREFIDARLGHQDVQGLLQAAAHLTLVDYEVGKAADSQHWWDYEQRGPGGQWTSSSDPVRAFLTSQDQGKWKGKGKTAWVDQDRYGKGRQIGNALSYHKDPRVQQVGNALSFAGAIGPEAEDILGPSLRRTAYRYRGTERRPDAALVKDMKSANRGLAALTSSDPEKAAAAQKIYDPFVATETGRASVAPSHIALVNHHRKGRYESPDQRHLELEADVATNYLIPKIASMQNAQLSMKAGKVPPSQGVLIDRDGDVVSQAVGFNGDHYLPFDLKNLKRLHGGQYVRTRVQGGPTTEDIYTGLMTGARQMTVASNTGVFTVEFDPDLRGGRRYNDKAHQMVGRYQAILQTIADNKATIGNIPLAQRQEMRQQALKESNNKPAAATDRYKVLLKEAEDRALFDRNDDESDSKAYEASRKESQDSINRGVTQYSSTQAIARNAQSLKGELRSQAADDSYRTLKLDGPGYAQALESLKEEFPFYIRKVNFVPLEKFQRERNLTDPKSGDITRSSIKGSDKGFVNASQVAFQSTGRNKRREVDAATATPEAQAAKESSGGGRGITITDSGIKTVSFETGAIKSELHDKADDDIKALKNMHNMFYPENKTNLTLSTSVNDPDKLVKYLSQKNPDNEALTDQFRALSGSDQDSMLATLNDLSSKTDLFQTPPTDAELEKLKNNGKAVADYLEIRKPFLSETNPLSKPGDRPITVPKVKALGINPKAYDKHLQDAQDDLPDVVKAHEGDPESLKKTLTTKIREYKDLSEEKQKQNPELLKEITQLQHARSFIHGRAIAQRVSRPGDDDPKASPASSGEPALAEKSFDPFWEKLKATLLSH